MQQTLFEVKAMLPTMLTKKQLRQHLGYPGNAIAHKSLKRRLIRDGILQKAGVEWNEIASEQFLPPKLTLVIIEVWQITELRQ